MTLPCQTWYLKMVFFKGPTLPTFKRSRNLLLYPIPKTRLISQPFRNHPSTQLSLPPTGPSQLSLTLLVSSSDSGTLPKLKTLSSCKTQWWSRKFLLPFTPPKFNSSEFSPEKFPKPTRKGECLSNHHGFSGAFAVDFSGAMRNGEPLRKLIWENFQVAKSGSTSNKPPFSQIIVQE